MRWIGVMGLLAGCAAPDEPVSDWGEVDGAALLDLDEQPATAFPDRVLPVMAPRARLVPDGPVIRGESGSISELVVVDPTPWPRVTVDADGVRVLLYVDRGALQQRVVAAVDGTGFGGAGRVVIGSSVGVQTVDERDDRVQVEVEARGFTAWAWLPRRAVDEVFTHEPLDRPPLPDGPSLAVLGGSEILDEPGGEALAVIDGEPRMRAEQIGEAEGGWIPIALSDGPVGVVGWVFEDDVERNVYLGIGGSGGSSCEGWGWSAVMFPHATVPEGTWLHAGIDGPVVGMALRDLPVPTSALELGADLHRATALGEVVLWAAPEDIIL